MRPYHRLLLGATFLAMMVTACSFPEIDPTNPDVQAALAERLRVQTQIAQANADLNLALRWTLFFGVLGLLAAMFTVRFAAAMLPRLSRAKATAIRAETLRLRAQRDREHAEAERLHAEAELVQAEAQRLAAEAHRLRELRRPAVAQATNGQSTTAADPARSSGNGRSETESTTSISGSTETVTP